MTIICKSNIKIRCPFCDKEYIDDDEKFLNRINRNKSGITQKKCTCGNIFKIAHSYGGLVSFNDLSHNRGRNDQKRI